jgi:hypothetical protein
MFHMSNKDKRIVASVIAIVLIACMVVSLVVAVV